MFRARYELNVYILFRINSVCKRLSKPESNKDQVIKLDKPCEALIPGQWSPTKSIRLPNFIILNRAVERS